MHDDATNKRCSWVGDNPLMRLVQMVRHWFNRNTRRQARRNIYAHYDIGNAFYSAWLDPSMTYSSALFEDDTPDLTTAQHNKYRRLAEAIELQPGQKLLEIGCGWGGFAEYAAKTCGAKVVGLTISREQRDFAQARMQSAGLGEKVEIRPNADASVARAAHQRFVDVTVTMRSGRAESWRQPQQTV